MTVALIILGAFLLATINLEHMADVETRKAVITLDLTDDADPGEMETKLWGDQRIENLEFVPKERALDQWGALMGLDPAKLKELEVAGLWKNPLPNAIIIKVKAPQDIPAVAATANKLEGAAKAKYRQQVTEKLLTLAHGIKVSGSVLAVVMGFACLLLVSTTIRLTIYARRREIRIMQLVGATNWFIRVPFVLEGAFHGLVGGVLAAVVLLGSYAYAQGYVGQNLAFIELVYGTQPLVLFGLGTVSCGMLFGVAGSWIGAQSYLRLI
jgi:cell division transport system permease protein